jgi:hypothetical protein
VGRAAITLAMAFLCFVAGGWVVLAEVWPYPHVQSAFLTAVALQRQVTGSFDRHPEDLWYPAIDARTGVVVHDPARVAPGATFYTSAHTQGATLVGADGKVLHEWRTNFREVFPDTSHLQSVPPDHLIYWFQATLLENGDVLAIYNADLNTPWGAGLIKIDARSKVIWARPLLAHHDLEVQPDGRIYVLTHKLRPATRGDLPLEIDDELTIVSPDGDTERVVSLTDALARSKYANLLHRHERFYNADPYDPLHSNAVEVLTARTASWVPEGREGHVLLSLRSPSALGLLDLEQEAFVWAGRGPWLAQHDPDLVGPNRVLIYDNRGHVGPEWPTRVLEVDLVTNEITWQYAGTPEDKFYSRTRGSQQLLPNGNVLMSEARRGRILEVTRGGEVVWDFRNPARGGDDNELVATVTWPERIPPERLGWLSSSQP